MSKGITEKSKGSTELMSPNRFDIGKEAEMKILSKSILESIGNDHTKLTTKEIEQEVVSILSDIGLESHYVGVTGGSKEIPDAKQSLKHVSVALAWTFAKKMEPRLAILQPNCYLGWSC
jgi:hypothetical protein